MPEVRVTATELKTGDRPTFSVTATDLKTSDSQTGEINEGDFILVCSEPLYLHTVDRYENGTVQLTLKVREETCSA